MNKSGIIKKKSFGITSFAEMFGGIFVETPAEISRRISYGIY